jgi:hypothetical protein
MKRKLLTQFLIFIGITLSAVMISQQGFSQTGKITGKVTDKDDGLPLPGVTIKVKGTTTAVGTNVDGLYSINAEMQVEAGASPFQDKNVLFPISLSEKNANATVAKGISGDWN